jgi:RsiW-degrading membrane proteinase PrsW (M82 family)
MKKQKGFKTSPYFWGLILAPVALGLYDFASRLHFRLLPGAAEWHAKSWLAAGGAALVFAAVIAWVDRYEHEPWKWLLLALIWGAMVAPAIGYQLESIAARNLRGDISGAVNIADSFGITSEQRDTIVNEAVKSVGVNRVGPFVEELSKGLFVFLIFLGVSHEFDDPVDGIVYGAMVGIGFAMTEQVSYLQDGVIKAREYYLHKGIIGKDWEGFSRVFHERILLTGLWSHPMLTAFTGAGLGWARVSKSRWQRWTAPPLGFGLAVLIHTNWNSLNGVIQRVSSFEQAALVLISPFAILMVMLLLLAWQRERKVLVHLAQVPVEFASQDVMRSTAARWRAQWKAWRQGGLHLWQQVCQLQSLLMERAFLEWHMCEGHVIDEEGAVAALEEYQSKVQNLVEQIAERDLVA